MKEKPLIQVSIYLRGHQLNPEKVTRLLGIQPSFSQTKGKLTPGSNKHIARIGVWALKIKSESRPISELIDELFVQIGNPTQLDKIEGVEDAHLDIFFAQDDDDSTKETVEFALTKNQILKMSQLGLSACVTVS